MIKDFEPRLYQQTIFSTCTSKNTLVVLPTGMGKTNIFLMLAAHRLKLYPQSKILFIGPTRPLIDQYLEVFKKHFEIEEDKMAVFTGHVKPETRAKLWQTAKIIFSTPQGLENDVISNRIKLEDVSLLGVDEAHRATGDYAYVWLSAQYVKRAKYPRILALTASPGSEMEKIEEICKNLSIEQIEVRTDDDPDVKQYVQEIKIEWVKVNLPPDFKEIQKHLTLFIKDRTNKLTENGFAPTNTYQSKYVNKTDLLRLQAELRGKISQGESDSTIWNSISVLAEIMKVQHAVELLETQGIVALHSYFEKLQNDAVIAKTKAIRNIVMDSNYRSALIKTQKLFEEKVQHPKLIELKKIIKELLDSKNPKGLENSKNFQKEIEKNKDLKLLVFNQYRDNAVDIVRELNTLPGIKAQLFVGQTKKGDTGLTQKEQKEVLDKFRDGTFNILVATSVGEEGLDVPKVQLVIFYEPIPSAIRTIQRRGRTGRHESGKVIVLMAMETRDVGYKWSAHHKEKRMYRTLDQIKKKLGITFQKPISTLEKYTKTKEETFKIIVDHRERGSAVIKELIELGIQIHLEKLDSADYLLSSRVGVEYKTNEDFVNSLIDGRLLQQMRELKENFERPLVLVEGEQDIYSIRNVHPNSIRGMMATILVSYGIPIIFTKNCQESASFLKIVAKREQEEEGSTFSLHNTKKEMSLMDWQEYIIGSLPGVGPTLAKPLLREFKSVKNIFNANQEQLQKIEKIGPIKANKIKEIIDSEYKV